jgi:putative RecB family exonuclease
VAPEYLSYSSISKYLSCGENWRRHYIAKEPTMSTPALVFGSAIHATIENYIEHRTMQTIAPDIQALWHRNWSAKVEAERNVDWGADTPTQHYDEGKRILATSDVVDLLDGIRPKIDTTGLFMERKISLNVPGVPIPIIGYIDIMTHDGVPGDFKTSSTAWTEQKAKEEIQPVFYLAALSQAGINVPGLSFRHYVITKTKTPKVQVIERKHTWNEIFWLFELIKSVWNGIEREVYPLNPGSWLCSHKYCSFYSSCRGRGM